MKLDKKAMERWIVAQRGGFETLLEQWVQIPSISMDPTRKEDVYRQVEAAKTAILAAGGKPRIVKNGGLPTVLGRFDVSRKCPTVTFYNHLDVQPADEPEWTRAPFEFRKDGDNYYGRGSTDDKGPALTALLAVRYIREVLDLPLNIRLIWESEEEIGSPHFAAGLDRAGAATDTDLVVVSDTVWVARGKPAVPTGLRGAQMITVHLETGSSDRHSGVTGGAARNPVSELAWLVGELMDGRTGEVHVPGFYDGVVEPSEEELGDFKRSGFSVRQFKAAHGFTSVRSKDPMDLMRRLWARPTMEIHGLVGGYTGPGVKTVIPPRAELKLSMRLVPGQDPKKIVRLIQRFVKDRIRDARVEAGAVLTPYRGLSSGPLAEACREAYRFGFGRPASFVREGGSIGAIVTMAEKLKVPIVFLGLSLPEHGYHAPNESWDWGQTAGGVKTFCHFLAGVLESGLVAVD